MAPIALPPLRIPQRRRHRASLAQDLTCGKLTLGPLCVRSHRYGKSRRSVRYVRSGVCVKCQRLHNAVRRIARQEVAR